MKQTRARLGSLLLVVAMLLTLLPVSAFAAEGDAYSALKAAIDAAPTDGTETTVILTGNITGMTTDQIITIKESQNIVLDMAGHSITVASDNFNGRPIVNKGTLTVKGNGTIDSSMATSKKNGTVGLGAIDNFGTLLIENGTYKGCVFGGAAIRNKEGASLTIENGYFESNSAVYNFEGATAIINGGEFKSEACNAIKDDTGAAGYYAYAFISAGNLYFNDGKVTGVQGALAINNGYAEVKNGTFETIVCNHDSNAAFYALYIAGERGVVNATISGGMFKSATRVAVNVGNDNTGGDGGLNRPANATITGGTFIGGGSGTAALEAPETGTLNITGGTFSSDPSAYVADGMKVTDGSSESFGVALNTDAFAAGTGTEADPYVIKTKEQLRAFAADVNAGHSYAGKYIQLGDNVTLTDEWTPIGNGARSGSTYTGNAFKGTFDGNGKTISGLKITTGSGDNNAIGLFGVVAGGTVKDLTLADVSINVSDNKLAGGVAGLLCDNGLISACNVSGAISIKDGAGGIVGRMVISGTVSGCTNNASVTCSEGGAAGIVGKAYYTQPDKTMTIENCVNNGAISNPSYHAGGISALCAANVTNCTNNGLITAGNTAGGIVAEQVNWGTVSGCTNTAEIKGDNNAGGIIGWVRYQTNDTYYAKSGTISVLNNTNNAVITTKTENKSAGGLGWGGIVGTVYNAALVSGNENTASSITGGTFGAGIVGNLQENSGNLYYDSVDIHVVNNISTTPLESITVDGICRGEYAYNNKVDSFVVEENSTEWVAQIGEQKYATLTAALDAAEDGHTIKLLKDLGSAAAIIVPAGVTLDGGNKTLTYTGGSVENPANGAFITVGGENVTIQNLTIETNNKIKHGVQFYSVKSGKVSSVTINGGAYTSVIVNNSQNITLENCVLNSNGYANIEYAIGSNISNMVIPSLTVDNVTFKPAGETGAPVMIWTDADTVGRIKTVMGTRPTDKDVVAKIKENVTNKNPDNVVISVGLSSGTVNEAVSGVGYPSGSTTYAITVDKVENGTVTTSRTLADKGLTVTLTVKADEGYKLDTITVTDKNNSKVALTDKGDGKYTFTMPASAVTVKATFAKDDTPVETGLPFTDVKAGDWYYDAVRYVYDNDLMNGTSATTFSPFVTTSRAMILTILARYDGVDTSTGSTWYEAGAVWAIAEGVSDGTNLEANLTREQLVTMLWRYAGSPVVEGGLADYPDSASVSDWAVNAMIWAVENGVITGNGAGALNPQGTATRAEVATILMRFIEK